MKLKWITFCSALLSILYFYGCGLEITLKDDTPIDIPANMVFVFKSAQCPQGFQALDELSGRVIIGQGSGNLDASGASLTARTFNTSGGIERTVVALGVNEEGSNLSNPFTGTLTETAMYDSTATENACLSGTDCSRGNIPPFVSYTYCEKTASSITELSTDLLIHSNQACPEDWSNDTVSQGRFIIGAGTGNLDANSDPISAYAAGDTGGKEETNSLPVHGSAGNSSNPTTGIIAGGAINIYSPASPDTSMYGDASDSNMIPFYVLNSCSPDGVFTEKTLPQGMIAAFTDSSCPSGWSTFDDLAGRAILSSGSGNTDRDGQALTARLLGASGGSEITSGIPAVSTGATTALPGPTVYFASALIYSNQPADGLLNGQAADNSNMSPFYVLNYCIKD